MKTFKLENGLIVDSKNRKNNFQKGIAIAILRSLKEERTLDGARGIAQSIAEMLRLPVGSYVDRERQHLVLVIEAKNIFAEVAVTLTLLHTLIDMAIEAIQTDNEKRLKREVLELLRKEVPILALLAPDEEDEEEE